MTGPLQHGRRSRQARPRRSQRVRRAAGLEPGPACLDAPRDRRCARRPRAGAGADRGSRVALAEARLTGELARTTFQLRTFAAALDRGAVFEVVIQHADAAAAPRPSPDLRLLLRPIGPVAVYSAGNFPFAFSVAGGDTASALAAGCPVVLKAHSGHLELSRATAAVVQSALAGVGAPDGTFALVEGRQAG